MDSESRSAAVEEALAIEEADAWFEYLELTRSLGHNGRYKEIEPWAWERLSSRLRLVSRKRGRLDPATA